jgi:hypothetical protein
MHDQVPTNVEEESHLDFAQIKQAYVRFWPINNAPAVTAQF